MNITKFSWLLVGGLLAMPAVGMAQETGQEAGTTFTLKDFVTDVVEAHPVVREQVHIFRQTVQDKEIAKGNWRPSVDFEASINRVEGDSDVINTTGSTDDSYTSDSMALSITQNLFNGFETKNFNHQAEARRTAALYELLDVADNIALEAAQAYIDALKQKRLLVLAQENVDSHVDTLNKIQRRSNSGAGRRSELEQTEGRVARARASYIAQRNNLQDSLTVLHELLGRYVFADELIEPQRARSVWASAAINDVITQALEFHPALKVAYANIEAAEYKHKRAHSTRYPKVDVRLAQEYANDVNGIPGDRDELSLSLNLSYNLYRGGIDRAERRKRVSEVHQQQGFAAKVRRQVINTARLAWDASQSLSEQLIYLEKHVVKSQQTMRSYQEEFFIGQRDLIDLLDAKNELNTAQNRYAESYYDSLSAHYRIQESIGDMFAMLDIAVEVEEDDLRLLELAANQLDELPLDNDLDRDIKIDLGDHCDNTLPVKEVNQFGCAQSDVELTQKPGENRAPIAQDDSWDLPPNGVILISPSMVMKNDYDPDGDQLSVELFSQPKNGYLANTANGAWAYRAKEGFTGQDSFIYSLKDGRLTSEATVTVNVLLDADISTSDIHYVNFEFGSTALTPASKRKAEKIVNKLRSSPELNIAVSTHTDNVGSDAFNQKLSEQRAAKMRELLTALGVAPERITAVGLGETMPIAENATEEGRAINRRGEFRFE